VPRPEDSAAEAHVHTDRGGLVDDQDAAAIGQVSVSSA
jgi:hypothetical protein